jgi:hypothetical protein
MAIYESLTDEEVMRIVDGKSEDRSQFSSDVVTAIDFLDGRQESATDGALQLRFETNQSVEAGQRIFPVTIPLTERYIAEAASAYNKPVRRYFVDEEGEETDRTRELSSQMSRALDAARYDEIMHRAEQYMVAFDPAPVGLWFQAKRGKLRPNIVFPHTVCPKAPDSAAFADAADPDDYDAFVVELSHVGGEKTHAFLTAAEHIFFEGKSTQADRILSRHVNPFTSMQVRDEMDEDSGQIVTREPADLPLQMLTFWHARPPVNSLMPETDVSIVKANLELNIAFSTMFDTISFQTHAIPVMQLNNASSPRAKRRLGARFPMVLNTAETFNYVSAAPNYVQQVAVLKDFVRLIALSKRMSSNDFAIDGAAPSSGFSKLVDSLPKLEAREEHLRRLTHLETQVAAPRIAAILTELGSLDVDAKGLRMKVEFSDVEFPKTEDEKTKAMERKLKHGLASAAQILAKEAGISEDEAQARIDENMSKRATQPQDQSQPGPLRFGGRIGQRA